MRKYYAWQGQNASTGEPNQQTGRMSLYGLNIVFGNRQDRDEYVDEFRSDNPSVFCKACTKTELRGYNLGDTIWEFENDLREMAITYRDDDDLWDSYYE